MTVSPARASRLTTWLGSQPLPPVTSVATDSPQARRKRAHAGGDGTASSPRCYPRRSRHVGVQEDRVSEQSGSAKAWAGRFAQATDRRLEAFNASVAFDVRMVREDIRGSIAHARMLGEQGIIGQDDADTLEQGLWQVLSEVDAGALDLRLEDEDVHTGVERRLRELVGPVAGKLHTGRSRNDQVATDLRLWLKGALLELSEGVLDLEEALTEIAAKHPDQAMPGYTHLQRAQPVLLAHHMLAYVAM